MVHLWFSFHVSKENIFDTWHLLGPYRQTLVLKMGFFVCLFNYDSAFLYLLEFYSIQDLCLLSLSVSAVFYWLFLSYDKIRSLSFIHYMLNSTPKCIFWNT